MNGGKLLCLRAALFLTSIRTSRSFISILWQILYEFCICACSLRWIIPAFALDMPFSLLLLSVILVQFAWSSVNGNEEYVNCPFINETTVTCHDEVYKPSEIANFAEPMIGRTTLDLSKNMMPYLKRNDFKRFGSMLHLNLSRNEITFMDVDAFVGLQQLVTLDLSQNKLRIIYPLLFRGLDRLERLLLSGNPIAQIQDRSFDVLPALNYLDLTSAPLICDCRLAWLSERMRHWKLRVSESTTCFTPAKVQHKRLANLDVGKFSCSSPVRFPYLEIQPAKHQALVVGDGPFRLECLATALLDGETHMLWTHNGAGVDETVYKANSIPNRGLMSSVIEFKQITEKDAGVWACHAWTAGNNETVSTDLLVLQTSSPRCSSNVTISSRGVYSWPLTFAYDITVELPCEDSSTSAKATRICDRSGHWRTPNLTACPFRTEFERVLNEYIKPFKLNEAILGSGYLKTYLLNQTADKAVINSERLDLILRALETILNTTGSSDILSNASKVADWLMDTPFAVWESGRELNVSQRLMSILMASATGPPTAFPTKNYIATVVPPHTPNSNGISCVVKSNERKMEIGCFEVGHSVKKRETEAAMTDLPETVISIPPPRIRQELVVVAFRNVKLFAAFGGNFTTVAGRVVGVFPLQFEQADTEGVFSVGISAPLLTSQAVPFWFLPSLASRLDVCAITSMHFETGLAQLSCHKFGLVTISQPLELLQAYHNRALSIRIPTFVYIAAILVIVTHVALLFLYAVHFASLSMPPIYKHCLLCFWMSINALLVTFLCGFSETSEPIGCIVIGVLSHYFTLCCLMWIFLSFFHLYKCSRKCLAASPPDPEGLPRKQLPNIGGLYLFGWGVPVILTGISAAVCTPKYANQRYCYLRMPDSLLALLLPAAITVFGCLVLCALIAVLKRSSARAPDDRSKFDSVMTHRTHSVCLFSTLFCFLLAYGITTAWAGHADAGLYRSDVADLAWGYGCGISLLVVSVNAIFVFWLKRKDLPKVCWMTTSKELTISGHSGPIVPVHYECYTPLAQNELPPHSPVTTHTVLDEVNNLRVQSPYHGAAGHAKLSSSVPPDGTDLGYSMQNGSGHVVSYASSASGMVTFNGGVPRYFVSRQQTGSGSSKIETCI